MTDDEIREVVREALARRSEGHGRPMPESLDHLRQHSSQARFRLGPGGDANGMCVIEPAVRCVHCGYCQSYGH